MANTSERTRRPAVEAADAAQRAVRGTLAVWLQQHLAAQQDPTAIVDLVFYADDAARQRLLDQALAWGEQQQATALEAIRQARGKRM